MRIISLITYLSAFLSLAGYLRSKGPPASILLWLPKLMAHAFAPILGMLGTVGAAVGLWRRDWKLVGAGVFSAGVALRHIGAASQTPDVFAEAFGANWLQQIPPDLRAQLRAARWSPVARSRGEAVRRADVIYGNHPGTDEPLLADIWEPGPNVARTGLAVIYAHGGAWRYGGKDMRTRPFFRHLVGQGHVVMDIAYTLEAGTLIEMQVGDFKRAILWLKEHAAEYQINPDRIVLMGGSAGGHLALLTAYTPNHSAFQPGPDAGDTSVRAVVAYYPPTDLEHLYDQSHARFGHLFAEAESVKFTPKDRAMLISMSALGMLPPIDETGRRQHFIAHIVGGTPQQVPGAYRLLSPSAQVGEHCPPTLLLQGTDDFFQLAPGVSRLHDALRRAGVTSVLIEYPGADHAFDLLLPQISPVAQAATYDVERFLALVL